MRINSEIPAVPDLIDDIAGKVNDNEVSSLSRWLHEAIEGEHKPTLAFVSFDLNHSQHLKLIKKVLGIQVPKEKIEMFEGEPMCLIVDYSEVPVLLNENVSLNNPIVFGIPAECLKNYRIVICDGISSKNQWLDLSNEIDIVCLAINATMAMNQMEKEWFKNCAVHFFDEKEIVIYLDKMNLLNDEEDRAGVRKAINNFLEKSDISCEIYEDQQELFEKMIQFVQEQNIRDLHKKRVSKNVLLEVEQLLKRLFDSVVIDESTISSAVQQLQKQQKYLELAGKMTSESILGNSLNSFKVQLCEGVRDFGSQISESVKKKIENCPIDKLESMEDKIKGYISGAWEYYVKSITVKINSEIEKITQKVTKQMELDAGNMVSELDDSARQTLYCALVLGYTKSSEFVMENQVGIGTVTGQITEQLQRETRNMMLLSIPIFFVNPLASIGSIFAVKAYGKYKTNNELNNGRTEIVNAAISACHEITESIVQKIQIETDDAMRDGSMEIQKSYGTIIQQFREKLSELNEAQKESAKLKEYIGEMLDNQIPMVVHNL